MDRTAIKKFQQQNLEIVGFLANGSYGDVYLIHDKVLNRQVVGKFNKQQNFANAKREAKILAQYNHPNIIKVLGELNWSDGTYVIILEQAPFGNLETFLHFRKNISISWKLRARFFIELASALNYLHNQDSIHGDLKPQNVLLGDMLVIKVADFGSAAATGTCNGTGNSQCTPLYAAPEFLNNPAKENKRKTTDIYSFAMIGYEILTRKAVYEGASCNLVEIAKRRGVKPQKKFIDDVEKDLKRTSDKEIFLDLKKTIKQCWKTDPSKRPSICNVNQHLVDLAHSQKIYDRKTDQEAKTIVAFLQTIEENSCYNAGKRRAYWVPIFVVRILLNLWLR